MKTKTTYLFLMLFAMAGVLNTWAQDSTLENQPPKETKPLSAEMQAYINHLMGLDKDQTPKTSMHKVNASSWNYPASTPATPYGGGTGTEADPYLISTPQHLANLAYMVNNGTTYSGKFFKMTDDLVLNTGVLAADGSLNSGTFKQWTPIGGSSQPFRGTFDGDNHYVSGLYISASSASYKGLFGYIADGLVTRTGVTDSYIYAYNYVGGIAGHSQYADITYCYSRTTIIAAFDIGGIVGDIDGSGRSASSSRSSCIIKNCVNYGSITQTERNCCAGITGYASSSVTVSYCANYGTIQGAAEKIGGIVGEPACRIENCINIGQTNGYGICSSGASNCYFEEGTGTSSSGSISKPASDFTNGSVIALVDPSGEHFNTSADGTIVPSGVGTGGSITPGTPVYKLTYSDYIIPGPAITQNLGSWTSTNHSDSSTSDNTINFDAKKDDVLSFSWSVSSESDYDKLYVKLDGTTIVNGVSGTSSSTYSKTFTSAGSHTLYMYYSKDGSQSSGSDEGTVSNVQLYSPSSLSNEEIFNAPIRRDKEFADWTSTNKEVSSMSDNVIEFYSLAGDVLTFDWETSSELDADYLNVYLDGTPIVSEQSGNGTTGNISKTLTAGNHALRMEYVKDDAKSRYNDEVYVRNIKLTYAIAKTGFEDLTLTDGAFNGVEVFDDFTVENFHYSRNFSNLGWQALYVPFSMSYEDWADEFEVAAINNFHQYDDNDDGVFDRLELEVRKVKAGTLKANHPYLIKAKSTGNKSINLNNITIHATTSTSIQCSSVEVRYTFTGTCDLIPGTTMLSQNYYAMGNGALVMAENESANLKPLRWYMQMESLDGQILSMPGLVKVFVWGEDDEEDVETGILSIDNKEEDTPIYDLNGVRVQNTKRPGIYIKNGKKFVVK